MKPPLCARVLWPHQVPPVSLILMFNCYRAEYALTMGDISTLPDAEDVPLRSTASLQTLGRVKIRSAGSNRDEPDAPQRALPSYA